VITVVTLIIAAAAITAAAVLAFRGRRADLAALPDRERRTRR